MITSTLFRRSTAFSLLAVLAVVGVALALMSRPVEAAATETAATGGGAISVDTAATATTPAWTTLTGPMVITEGLAGDIAIEGPVTIIFTVPAGFEFNTGIAVDVAKTGADITSVVTPATVAATTITVTYTAGGVATNNDTITIGGVTAIQVRPTGGTPATGNITRTGGSGAAIAGITGANNFGTLTSVVGAASKLAVTTEPTASTVAGVAFAQQPVITVQDQFSNTVTGDTSTVALTLTTGTGALSGTASMAAVAGVADFVGKGLSINLVGADKVLTATDGGLTLATTAAFTITNAAASKLAVTTPPSASTVAGVAIATQPVVTVQDPFGNTVTGDTSTVALALTTGTGALSGTVSMAAVAGVADFVGKGLSINLVGADKVLTATDGGLTQATTAAFTITHAAAAKLILTTPPSASTAPTVAFAQQPIVTIQDAFNNTVTSDSASVITAALTTGTGTLAGTVTKTAASGIADFAGNNLAINLVGADKVLTFTSGGLTQAVSAAFTIAAPVASAATSTITAAPTEILGNGAEASTITVQLKDGGSANLSAGGDTVTLSTDLGTLSAVTDNGDGTYTATLTSLVTGPATVTGTVNTVAITATAAVTVNAISLPPAAPTADEPGVEVVLDPATTEPVSTTEEVALSTTSTDGSTATITVPPAALPDGATVEVAGVADVADLAAQTAPPAGVGLLLGFSITAADAAGTAVTSGFSSPVALEFTVDASSLPSGAGAGELRTAFWNGTAWVPLDSVVTINADGSATISADTDHFSLYSVIHDAEGFGRIAGQVPATGVGFVTFGGSVAELQTAMIAAGCSNPAFVTSNGAWVSYLPDGPFAAINADFEALFAEGVPLGRALIVSNCG